MIPFTRMLKYGNRNWYSGSELIAWDSAVLSSILGGSGSTEDYTGKTIQNTRFSGSGSGVLLGTESDRFEYGVGVRMSSGTALYNRTLDPSFLTSSWTLDYWTKQSGVSSLWHYGSNSIAISATAGMLSSGNRLVFGAYYDSTTTASNLGLWNNVNASGSYFVPSEYRDTWVSSTWVHVCIQYDASTNTFYMYQDGVLIYQFVYAVQAVNISTTYCGCSNPGSAFNVFVERYRLREGLSFNLSGFSLQEIYV